MGRVSLGGLTGLGSRWMVSREMRPCSPASTASSTTSAEKAVESSRPTAPAQAREDSDLIRHTGHDY